MKTRSTLIHRIILLIFFSLFTGCLSQIPPPEIAGPVETTGLVVVDVKINLHDPNNQKAKATMIGAVLVSVPDPSKRIKGKKVSGYILFSDLPPGIYRLHEIKATWVRGQLISREYYSLTELRDEVTVPVSAGQPTYLGRVIIDESRTTNEGTVKYAMKRNPQYEVNALHELAFRYEGSLWAERMKERVKALTGQ